MTADAIREQLEQTHSITVDRNGTEFFIAEDEGGNGWYAWRTPADDGAIADKSFDAEVIYPDGLLGTPDFRALSEEVAALDRQSVQVKETAEERAERRAATDAMRLHPNTRFLVCAIHGSRGHVVDIYEMNNWEFDDSMPRGVRCESSHPYCFGWCSAYRYKKPADK